MGRKRNRDPDPRSRSAERKRRRRREKNNTSEAESCFPNIILPEDIVVEILSRLPLGSLTRFTCVSKHWRTLISNICATKTGSPTVLLISTSRAYSFSPRSVDRNHRKEVHAKRVYVPWKKMELYIEKFRILGSCNGLLLMHINEDVFLWNPLTRFFKKMLAYEELRDQGYGVCSGLCYDSTSIEYKAVLSRAHSTPDYGGEFVVVGSFRSKSWTVVDFPYKLPSENMGTIVNGNLHWFASRKHSGSRFFSPHQIILFNAQMDKFEEVPMPKPTEEDGDSLCGLGVLDGCLCMSRSDSPGDYESNVEVLIMKEYGVKSSWTILFVVSDHRFVFELHDPLVPLGYTKNGRVLIKVPDWGHGHIRAFDLTDDSHRRISIPEHDYLHVFVHEESLITPTDYNWEEEDLKGVATYVQDSSHSRKMIMKKVGRGGYWPDELGLLDELELRKHELRMRIRFGIKRVSNLWLGAKLVMFNI